MNDEGWSGGGSDRNGADIDGGDGGDESTRGSKGDENTSNDSGYNCVHSGSVLFEMALHFYAFLVKVSQPCLVHVEFQAKEYHLYES